MGRRGVSCWRRLGLFVVVMSAVVCGDVTQHATSPTTFSDQTPGGAVQPEEIEGKIVGMRVLKRPKKCPRKVKDKEYILLHYVARIVGGEKPFHSTYEQGAPMPLITGSGQYFAGFHRGALTGMCEKEVRQLTIPWQLAFGHNGFGTAVPPRTDVEYTVKAMGWLDDEMPEAFR